MKYTYTKEKRDPQIQWYKTESGKRWRVKFSVVKKGKRHYIQQEGIKSFAAAQLVKAQLLTDIDNNTFSNVSNMKVKDYWLIYSEQKAESGEWALPTQRTQANHFNKHILPTFANYKLSDVTRLDVQAWANERSNLGEYSQRTLRSMVNAFKSMLEQLVINGELPFNPAVRIKTTGREPRDQSMTHEQYAAIRDYIFNNESLSDSDRAIFVMSLHGLRRGEIAGLRLKYIHKTHITVAAQLTTEGNRYILPKKNKVRDVPLMPGAYDLLMKAAQQSREKIARTENRIMHGEDYVFLASCRIYRMTAQTVYRLFTHMSDELGFEVWPHKMRHAFSTFSFSTPGANPRDIANVLGHSDVNMSMMYNVGTEDGKTSVVNALHDTF